MTNGPVLTLDSVHKSMSCFSALRHVRLITTAKWQSYVIRRRRGLLHIHISALASDRVKQFTQIDTPSSRSSRDSNGSTWLLAFLLAHCLSLAKRNNLISRIGVSCRRKVERRASNTGRKCDLCDNHIRRVKKNRQILAQK